MQLYPFILAALAEWTKGLPEGERLLNDDLYRDYGPRLLIHDLSHLVGGVGFYAKGEEAAAIIQGVLTRDMVIRPTRNAPFPEGKRDIPSFETLSEDFFATIRNHIQGIWKRHNRGCEMPEAMKTPLDEGSRRKYYRIAVEFDRLFTERFGKPVYEYLPGELGKLDSREVVAIIKETWRNLGHVSYHPLTPITLRLSHEQASDLTTESWKRSVAGEALGTMHGVR